MAIRILSGENITGTITGIGIYTAGNSVKIFEAQRSGGAVKSDWSYDDATTDMSLGTNTNHAFNLKTNNTNRISIDNAGNVGMGISPTEKLDIFKDSGSTYIRVYDSSANSEVGLKLQNDAKTWTLQNWGSGGDNLRLLNNAGNIVQLWDDNGNVMIGNANDPEKKLHIYTSTTDDTPQVLIQNGSSGDASLTFNVSGQSYVIGIDHDDSSKFKIAASGNLGTNDRVTVLSTGEVGIGTITPNEKLVIGTTGGAQNIEIGNSYIQSFNRSGSPGYASLNFYASSYDFNVSNATFAKNIIFTDGAAYSSAASIRQQSSALIFSGGSTGYYFNKSDNSTTHMFINSSGNVGIGTTLPSTKLEVRGGAGTGTHAHATFTATTNRGLKISTTSNPHGQNSGTVLYDAQDTEGYSEQHWLLGGNTKMVLNKDGNVGIGPQSNGTLSQKLQVSSGTNTDGIILTGDGTSMSNNDYRRIGFRYDDTDTSFESEIRFVVPNGSLHGGQMEFFTDNTSGVKTRAITIDNAQRVGIGIATPNTGVKLEVNGIISANGDQSPTGGGLGFGDYQSGGYKWIQSFESQPLRINPLGNNVLFPSSNVGIGLINPTAKLQVVSGDEQLTNFSGNVTDRLAYSRINSFASTSGTITGAAALELVGKANASGHGRHVWIGAEGTSNTNFLTKLKFKIRGETDNGYAWAGSSEAPTIMTLEGDGNVGIGTSSPQSALEVVDSTNYKGIHIRGNAAPNLTFGQNLDTTAEWKIGISGFNGDSFAIGTGTGANDKVHITSTGNVGIGTTLPTAKLTIDNGSTAGGSLLKSSSSSYTAHFIANTGSGNAGIYCDASNGDFIGSDYVFFGQHDDKWAQISTGPSASGIRFMPADSIKMVINNSGNVGIGITNPAEKLHVNGRTILQNTEYSDYAAGSINTTGVVVATVPSSTNGQSVMITFEATGGSGSVYSVIYSCYNGGGNWYYTKNVLIFGGNIEVAETNGSGSSTLSFSFRATSGTAAYTPRVVMKGSPYGLVSFI